MLAPALLALSLARPARADSFLTSIELVRSSTAPLPSPGTCEAEIRALGPNRDAFDHAAVIGACHGYDRNSALVDVVTRDTAGSALRDLDLGYVLVYEATYAESAGKGMGANGVKAVRAALKAQPADARVWLVAALVLAQEELFVAGGSWDKPNAASREVVGMVRRAAQLNRAAPSPDFQPSLDAAVEYMTAYGVYAELVDLKTPLDLPPTTGTGD